MELTNRVTGLRSKRGRFEMDLVEPKHKRHCKLKRAPCLPVPDAGSKFTGVFNEFSVVISDEDAMKQVVSMGYFGKATLSRTYPQWGRRSPEIIRSRVFVHRQRWLNTPGEPPKKVVVVPDSDEESSGGYFENLRPMYQLDRSGVGETVNLGLEEAFFLAEAVGCLQIRCQEGHDLSFERLWGLFKACDSDFVANYVAYYYFRAKNWVVKTGSKFGGDFLLYKQGPPFYHASYVVIIDVLDQNLKRIESRRSMDMVHLMGLNRLCETAGKELLIAQIVCPDGLDIATATFTDLNKFAVREVLMKRWISSQERQERDGN